MSAVEVLLDALERSACRPGDLDVFYPEAGGTYDQARALCGRCPVLHACLEYVELVEADLPPGQVKGFAAGLRSDERLRSRREAAPEPAQVSPQPVRRSPQKVRRMAISRQPQPTVANG